MTDRKDAGARERPVSRRRLLGRLARAGTLGAGAAVLGGAVMAEPALAGTDGDVVLGADGQMTAGTTGVVTSAVNGLHGQSSAQNGRGVYGYGNVGVFGGGALNGVEGHTSNDIASGVYGQNDGAGYGAAGRANNGTGVLGDTHGGVGVRGIATSGTGIFGHSDSATGIYGEASGTTSTTYGVHGHSVSAGGAAVLAENLGGTGLQVMGKARFSSSGRATIAAGDRSVTLVNKHLTKESFVLATLQKNVAGDVWIKAAVPDATAHSLTIFLNAPAPSVMPVAWFVLN
jgi:hypothetical protein